MPTDTIMIISAITGVFAVFSAVLAFGIITSSK